MNLFPSVQILENLELIPDLVVHLPLSIVVESLRINGVSVFDEIDDVGLRHYHSAVDFKFFAKAILPHLLANDEARLIILSDVRECHKEEEWGIMPQLRVPHAITATMHGLVHLMEHREFSQLVQAQPERILVVMMTDDGFELQKECGTRMIQMILQTSDPHPKPSS